MKEKHWEACYTYECSLFLFLLNGSTNWSVPLSTDLNLVVSVFSWECMWCIFNFNFPNPGFPLDLWVLFLSFRDLSNRDMPGLQGPIGLRREVSRQPCHLPLPHGELAVWTAPIAWDGIQDHIIEGIRWEQKFLCFIYSIIVEGWKAISQLCLGVDLQ